MESKLLEAIQEFKALLEKFLQSQERIEGKLIEVHKTVELIDKNQDYFSIATGEKLVKVLEQNKDLNLNLDMINDNLRDNGTMLQSVHKGGMTFLLQLESLRTYIQQLARLNGWKLPEKQKKPPAVE